MHYKYSTLRSIIRVLVKKVQSFLITEINTYRSCEAVSETLCPIPQRRILNMSAAPFGFLNNLQKTKKAATITLDASLPS